MVCRNIIAAGLLGLVIAGCNCPSKKHDAATTQPMAKAADYPTIVHIVSRHQTITIKSSPQGPRYSIRTDDGTMLLADATGAEFEKADPALYQQMRHYIATQADTADAVDAGLGVGPAPHLGIDASGTRE